MTQVKIQVFKASGSWTSDYVYQSKLKNFDTPALIEEAKKTHKVCRLKSFTIEVEEGNAWNKTLVIYKP